MTGLLGLVAEGTQSRDAGRRSRGTSDTGDRRAGPCLELTFRACTGFDSSRGAAPRTAAGGTRGGQPQTPGKGDHRNARDPTRGSGRPFLPRTCLATFDLLHLVFGEPG